MEGGGTPFSSSMAPSGSYILIIVSQPVNDDHKKVILERLSKGLLSWDVESTGCDLSGLETVCSSIDAKHLDDTDVLIQHSTESLGVEVLVSPTVSTLKQCVRNLFSTSTGHKHLIHAGYTFAGTGSWILQNGTFSFDDFLHIFQQADVQSQKRCNIHVHCAELGSWNEASFAKDIFSKVANVSFNPPEKVGTVPGSEYLISCLEKVLSSQALEEIMEASTLVGNIRFNRPTLYMFPAGQGDCALFGINGFNMLIDGGFNRKPCSWEFIRHLDRLDAVLVTRLCENNVCGMSTLMQRKSLNNTYPQIGYVFCNIGETKSPSSKEEMIKNKDDLVVSVVQEGHNFTQKLNELKLKPHQCWQDSSVEPFVLYHKVGHGTLEMHVLSPPKDSKEMKDFLTEWGSYKETFSCIKSGKSKSLENAIPLSHATSICAVLIWRPADPKDTITRILFPGSAPQSKIFESLERLKTLDVLKQPVVTKASLSMVITKTLNNKVEKTISRASIPNRKNTASPALSVSSVASRNGDVGVVKKEALKKVTKEVKKDNKDVVKKEIKKEVKKDAVIKEIKKTAPVLKKDAIVKKETVSKEIKKDNKDVKQVIKKEKDLKAVIDKKAEVKSTVKKVESVSSVGKASEVKKTMTTTVKKSTTVKKEVNKTASTPKSAEVKKSTSKVSEPKAAKEVSNKKAAEAKVVAKTKPKPASSATKTTPKSTPKAATAVSKSSNKVTKAVAASSIVASVVAVTAAAVELNEKKEEIIDTDPEVVTGKEIELGDLKDLGIGEKSEDLNVSPLPPEALSPTPSESISLTPSDTLSSAPLETVSPTPPLANEHMSVEEKEVNEIKEIEQDPIPYEIEIAEESKDETADEQDEIEKMITQHQENADVMSSSFMASKDLEAEESKDDTADAQDEIEKMIAQHQENADVMSSSFIASKDLEAPQFEEVITKTEASTDLFTAANILEVDSEKVADDKNVEKEKPEYNAYPKEVSDIDDQLAHLSMEGSFCAGRNSYAQEDSKIVEMEVSNKFSEENQSMGDKEYGQEAEEHPQIDMSRSFIETNKMEAESDDAENINQTQENGDQFSHSHQKDITMESNLQNNELSVHDLDCEYVSDMQEKEVADGKYHDNRFSPEALEEQATGYRDCTEKKDGYLIEKSFGSRIQTDDYDLSRNIIEDSEMQETSVDEPEEIVRKESVVSITLNDENSEVDYDDDMRRKSCTESEDDVDIQNYMINDRKDSFNQDKLNPRADADSDNEDVVKSPTPHAIVDYEGQPEDVIGSVVEPSKQSLQQNTAYLTEKQDFDEKDRDSAEDLEQEDTDDGEMIRHPTPELKYSEDEMRDPIGQHYITAPGLKPQAGGISEQPLYEEPEDAGSERSVSPVVEQPVFGSVVEADFPELVTVSGGTTPSEPHSPKAGFDSKKFVSESAVMDALSEHDCSEGSSHSPLCYDGNTAFEMPITEEHIQKENKLDLGAEKDSVLHEGDSKNLLDNKLEEKDLHGYETEGKDLHGYEQDSKDLHGYEQDSKDLHGYEQQDSKDLHGYEQQDSKDLHGYEQDSKDLHDYEQDSKDLHGYEQDSKDLHGYEQDSKDLHGYEQDSKDLHGYEQDSKDLHGYEQDSKDLHGYEQDSKDLHGYEQDSKDLHGYELDSKDLHGYEQKSSDLHGDEQESRNLHSYEMESKLDEQESKSFSAFGQDDSNLNAFEKDVKNIPESQLNTLDLSRNESTQNETIQGGQQSFHDDKLGNISNSNYDVPSDEESCSQNDKSETRSEKSDGEDEKSDIHRDDRSDHHHDSKSDMMDDDQIERRSDIQEDDRSDSHFDDKQDGYDGKESTDVPEDTRSHNFGSEQFRMDDAEKYEMEYEKYEIQEKCLQNVVSGFGDGEMSFVATEVQNKSFESGIVAPPEVVGFASNSDLVDDISENKQTASQNFGDFKESSKIIQAEMESYVYSKTDISTTEGVNDGTEENEEHPGNYNIPSVFHDDDLAKNLSNIPSNDKFNEFNISSQIPLDTDKINVDPSKPVENFESSYDKYENIQTKETYSEFTKDNADGAQVTNYSVYEHETMSMVSHDLDRVPGELSFDSSKFQEFGENATEKYSTEHDVISPQHTENLSGMENKVLTQIPEAHQYETLSKFEENVHTSNIAYSESSSIKNIISNNDQQVGYAETTDFEDKKFNLNSEETMYSTSQNYKLEGKEHDFNQEITEASYLQMSRSMHSGNTDEGLDEKHTGYSSNLHNFGNHGFDVENATHFKLDNTNEISSQEINSRVKETEYSYTHGIDTENFHGDGTDGSVNDKEQTTWNNSVTGFSSQHATETSSVTQEHTSYTMQSEQETSYIINSRFHSDSPEDNIMRSDSSPDVPPYPLDASGQLADMTITKNEYPNMNVAKMAAAPLSPTKARNANHDSPYDDSSEEEEDSSSIPGNVSPYAYTNKAYAKEEEDVDGNHIYKETVSTEITKEFDGNNPLTKQNHHAHEYQETTTELDANNLQTMTTHQVGYSTGYQQETEYSGETNYDFRLEEWGKPMGLPTPPDSASKTVAAKKPEKKSLGKSDTNGKTYSPSVSKMSSPMKKPKGTKEPSSSPVYVDLAYVPHHGDPQYCDVEFFKKVRARYYVFSGINPSKEVLNALLEAKKGWKEDLEVTIIPTYETDTLGYWMAQNQDDLAEYSIEVAPSASRCTVNLQDHETSCAAYRLEF